MKLFTAAQHKKLLANGAETLASGENAHHLPIVKWFTPDANCTWLISEIDPENPDIAFGLCDLGMGFPELGNVSIAELSAVRGRLGLHVERDRFFKPTQTLTAYAERASEAERIVA